MALLACWGPSVGARHEWHCRCSASNESKMNFGSVQGTLKMCMGGCVTFDLFGSSGISL
jgi:hypothetical protein